MTGQSFQLRLKVLIGLSVFILIVILNGLYQFNTIKLTEQNHSILGELNLLEEVSNGFIRRADNYVANAARDFESYNRDVQIFHKDILADINHFSEILETVSKKLDSIGLALPSVIGDFVGQGDDLSKLNASISMTNEHWGRFSDDLDVALGDNKDQPRIEWGARHIASNGESLNNEIGTMAERYRDFLVAQGQYTTNILRANLIITVLLGIIGLIWFYQKVTKRIGYTVDACMQVANGDFGYKLRVEGNDELTVLAKSFNALSSRSQLVLAMLGELQQAYSNEQALDMISQSAGGYLPIAWAGLMKVDTSTNKLLLTSSIPEKTNARIPNKDMSLESGFGQIISDALVQKEPAMLGDLRQYVVSNPDERLLRELVRATDIDAIAAIPLRSRRGWEGILLFGSRGGQYRKDQTELLGRLSPLMASSFERIETGGDQTTIMAPRY